MVSISSFNEFDKSGMLGIMLDFPNQCRIAKEIGERFKPSKKIMKPKLILWCGMGGSAIGGDVIASYLKDKINVSIIRNRHYDIPTYVDKDTLVLISSYSGNTEETRSCYAQAKSKRSTILMMTSGGKLAEAAVKNGDMLIVIPQGLPPRCALGYSSIPIIMAFSKLGLIGSCANEIDETIALLRKLKDRLSPMASKSSNISLKLAEQLYGKFPLIYASIDHFEPVAYRWRTQIEENAKSLASHHIFAEMNHNEIEGFEPFSKVSKDIVALYLRDKGDHPRIKRRMAIIKDIIKGKKVKLLEVNSMGESVLARIFSTIYIGDWVSLYLAVMNKVDPTPVHRIAYLKRRLGE